ncbi:MAG: COX15/CtaA family protein [Micrococcales bacterium]|nr:COX15/CtaA family protein [Micrococcales bacterium]
MLTPLGWAAQRFELGPRALRWGTTAALVVAVLVVLGGGVVRVTGSGLGCPTWPACEGTSIAPVTPSVRAVIEFGNRLVTVLLIAAVAWAIIAARLQRPRDRMLTRLAWSQFWLVVANALAGGVTVLARLNPWLVALHFVLAIGLLTTATLTWHRARTLLRSEESHHAAAPRAPGRVRALAWATTGATLLLILIGTLVTGAGPHSGDSAAVTRMPFDWTVVVRVHGILGGAVIAMAVALWVLLARTGPRLAARRAVGLVAVLLAQGGIGLYQALDGLPEVAVALHVLGSALVWIGMLRVLLDTDSRLFAVHERGPRMRSALPANA